MSSGRASEHIRLTRAASHRGANPGASVSGHAGSYQQFRPDYPPEFYAEARRALRPGGLIAAWTYSRVSGGDPGFDAVLDDFFFNKLGVYWPQERRHVEAGYSRLPFPFDRLEAPAFEIRLRADIDWMLGYMRTWSACQRYLKARGRDPVTENKASLRQAWGGAKSRQLRWKMPLLLGWCRVLRC